MTEVSPSTQYLLTGPFREEAPFWEALRGGRFELPRCAGCNRWAWPPTPRCPDCGSFDHVWEETPMVGSIYSWTRIWTSFAPQRAADGPFVVVLVELPHAGKNRVIGTLEGTEDGLGIGAAVRGRIKPPSPEAMGLASVVWSITNTDGAAT